MGQILSLQDLNKLSEHKRAEQKLVLVGGCFDILHRGHIDFLKKAKQMGDALIVLLEPDTQVKKLKGSGRPVNSEIDRAIVLSNLSMVDYVLVPKNLQKDSDYEALVKTLQPDIIAVTDGDRVFPWEKKYTIRLIKREHNASTSKIIRKIRK